MISNLQSTPIHSLPTEVSGRWVAPGSGDEWWLGEPEVDLVTLEAGFGASLGEFPSLGRLTVGMSNRLRVTPRYWGTNELVCGDRYGEGVCNIDNREGLWWP